jgi:membrane-associated phospholipid phosphatase
MLPTPIPNIHSNPTKLPLLSLLPLLWPSLLSLLSSLLSFISSSSSSSLSSLKSKIPLFIKNIDSSRELRNHSFIIFPISVFLCILSILYFDQWIAQYFNNPSFATFRTICRYLTDLGLMPIFFVPALLVYFFTKYLFPHIQRLRPYEKQRWILWKGSRFTVVCFMSLGLLTQLFKILFGRQRPHVSETFESWIFNPINFHWHWHSFPSGHSQVVFTAATISIIFWPKYKFFFLFLASLIAFTRITTHQHFLSDTIFGATLGYLVTLWIYQFFYYPKK